MICVQKETEVCLTDWEHHKLIERLVTFTTGIDLQLLILLSVVWSSFHRKIPLQVEVIEVKKKHPTKGHAVLTQYNRISFVLIEACKFVKTFISLSMSPFGTKAYTADTIYWQNKSQIEK